MAAYGRNGGICKDQFTANSPGNLPVKSFVNRLRLDRTVAMSSLIVASLLWARSLYNVTRSKEDTAAVAQQWDGCRMGKMQDGAKSRGPSSEGAPGLQALNLQVITIRNYLRCMGVLCTWVKLLTDVQILGCDLHKNAFGDRARPEPSGKL